MTDHPITPPPELVEQWRDLPEFTDGRRKMIMVTLSREKLLDIATQAARWGADQELEACLMEIRDGAGRIYIDETKLRVCLADDIWTARRPHPPSLKEQALETLRQMHIDPETGVSPTALDTIRRALEQLDDH